MKVFNTITRKKEEFNSINKDFVTMYVCGPTVYDLFHIGNARTFVVFDVVRRYLEYKGYKVKFIQNFTDIDDKIINKANKEGKHISQVSERYIKHYYEDADKLNIKRATLNPRATENIKEMIDLILHLIEKGFAYEVNGDVYFSIKCFSEYGKLFGQDIKTLKVGSRIEVNKNKKDPLDFILWKKSKENELGYDSVWGKGRPGWHTECGSMIYKYFDGNTIDIHGGGGDLIFPHHENEIAQIEALTGKPLANYWMHCSFLSINDEKMSKSLNNFFTTREILSKYSSNCLRFFILSSHYRNELCYSEQQIIWAEKSLERIYKCYFSILDKEKGKIENVHDKHISEILNFKDKFIEKMDDDFNTSDGMSVIFEFIRYVNSFLFEFTSSELKYCKNILVELLDILGINIKEIVERGSKIILTQEIKNIIMQRYECKKNKDFVSADSIREKLLKMNILLEDIQDGVRVIEADTNVFVETILYQNTR